MGFQGKTETGHTTYVPLPTTFIHFSRERLRVKMGQIHLGSLSRRVSIKLRG